MTQKQLLVLSLAETGISGNIPTWFWNISSELYYMNLSCNQLSGEIQEIVSIPGGTIDLSSNQFNGSLPLVPSMVDILDLSHSSFSGSLFHFLCDRMDQPKALSLLNLGNNLLSGEIPDCWMNLQNLRLVNMENNNLTGNVPSSMGYLYDLRSLHLRNNHLSGDLPPSLQNCRELLVVDLGENEFGGSLPIWIGKSLSELMVLNFRSNKLQGNIPSPLCNLKNLQILDLSHNNLSGQVPRFFQDFRAMANFTKSNSPVLLYRISTSGERYKAIDKVTLMRKGKDVEYNTILRLVTSMDLSDNILSSEIPEELTSLLALQSLNLLKNLLTGRIPSKIGNMRHLESLDLSKNQISGEIPPSMTRLTFLSRLNLSYNNLMGRIPESTQLQSFEQSSFVANKLCGTPLEENCSANVVTPQIVVQEVGHHFLEESWSFYLSTGLGFFFGFWSVLGSLLLNIPWRIGFCKFLDSIVQKLISCKS